MSIRKRVPAVLVTCLMASACIGTDSVLFVTTTNIGIDADTAPPNVTIAYDRYEGYFGPAYESGALPPVVARLESNTSVFSPEIRQLYATGDAADLVSQKNPDLPKKKEMKTANKRVAFFGTGSVVGLKVAFTPNGWPQSLSLGYKRKEFSLIPVMENKTVGTNELINTYGSVLASFGINVKTPNLPTTSLGVDQFFATGIAADNLAASEESIRSYFKFQANQALRSTEFYWDDNSQALLTWLKQGGEKNAAILNEWIKQNGTDGCRDGGDLMYTESCKLLSAKAVKDLVPH